MEEDIVWPEEYKNLPDDYANDKEVLAYRKQLQDAENLLEEIKQMVVKGLKLAESDIPAPEVADFFMLSSLGTDISFADSFTYKNPLLPVSVFFINYSINMPSGKRIINVSNQYFIGLIRLKTPYPNILITPETVVEKMMDVFVHKDIDFKHAKKFSAAYFVQSDDENASRQKLGMKNLDELAAFKQLEIEFKGNQCLFRVNRKSIDPQNAQQFCEAAKLLNKVFNE